MGGGVFYTDTIPCRALTAGQKGDNRHTYDRDKGKSGSTRHKFTNTLAQQAAGADTGPHDTWRGCPPSWNPHPTPPLCPPLRVASTEQSWPPGRSCPSHPRARTGPRLLPCQGVRYLPLCLFPQVHGHLCDQSPSLAHTCLAAHPAGEVGLPATSFVIPEPGKPDPHLTPSFPPSDKSIKQSLH